MNVLRRMLIVVLTVLLFAVVSPVDVSAADNIIDGAGFVMTSKLRLYSRPDSRSEVVDTAVSGECVVILEEDEDWCRVNFNLQEGYMLTDCLSVCGQLSAELGYGKIRESIVYLRSGPGTEYTILSSGFRDKEYYILGVADGWYKLLKDDATCYVRSDLLKLTEIPYENEASETDPQFFLRGEPIGEIPYTESEPVAAAAAGGYYGPISGSALLAKAAQYVGVPYVYGGASPDGFDCSGLIFYALSELGYSSYRTAADQYSMGTSVDRDSLRAGDLVFFADTYTCGISHVGIYAGGGEFLHAPNSGSSVCYSSLSGYWDDHYYGARRLG